MSYRLFHSVMLGAALIAGEIQGKEPSGKPIVYDDVTKGPSAIDAAAHKQYDAKFKVIDLADRSLTHAKCTECEISKRPRDASGKVLIGSVRVVFIVSSEGRIVEPFVFHSSNPLVNASALGQIKLWRFTPARREDLPVATLSSTEINFEKPQSQKGTPGFAYARAIDAKGVQHSPRDDPDGLAPWMEDVTKRVQPESPHNDDRQHQGEGWGVFRVMIDLKTGIVTDVITIKSTEHYALDSNARVALRQWRWKPGKWRQVDIPVSFGSPEERSHYGGSEFPRPLQSFPAGVTP